MEQTTAKRLIVGGVRRSNDTGVENKMDYEVVCYECNEILKIRRIEDKLKLIHIEPCTHCMEMNDGYDDGHAEGFDQGYAEAESDLAEEKGE